MILTPDQYAQTSAYDLLMAAAKGMAGLDQRLFHAILDRPDHGLTDIVRFANEADEDLPVDLTEDLIFLFHQLKAPEGVPFLVKVVEACGGEPPEEISEAICAIGAPALEPLLELFGRSDLEVRGAVALQLAGLGVRDPRLLEAFLGLLKEDVFNGALALGLYGDPAARPAVEEALAAQKGNSKEDVRLRRELEMCVRELSGDIPRSEPLEFDIYDHYPDKDAPVFEVMEDNERLEFFTCPLKEYRELAAASFAGEPLTPEVCDKLLEVGTSDAEVEVRAAALRALSEAAEDDKVKPKLNAILRDKSVSATERVSALVALAGPEDEELKPFIREFYDNPETRAEAMESMWKSFDPAFRTVFPRHLDDANTNVKRQAILGIGYLGIGPDSGKLVKLFEDEEFRDAALFAYTLSVPGETKPSTVKHLFRKVEKVAGELSVEETELVEHALDQRLMMHGLDPVFYPDDEEDGESSENGDDECGCGHLHHHHHD